MAIEPKEWAEGDLYPAARMTELESETAAAKSTADKALTSDSELDMTKIGETTAHSRDVMRSDSAAKTRQIIGAGTSSLTIGTTGSTAAAGDHKHSYADLTNKPTIPSTDGLASQSALDELAARVTALESGSGGGE